MKPLTVRLARVGARTFLMIAAMVLVGCQEDCPPSYRRSEAKTCVSPDLQKIATRAEKDACPPGEADLPVQMCSCRRGESTFSGIYGPKCGSCQVAEVIKWCTRTVEPPRALMEPTFANAKLALAREHCDFAREIFGHLAMQGHEGAQFELGRMYQQQSCTGFNFAEADRWLRQAANKGVPEAFAHLGFLYQRDARDGGVHDLVQAVMFFKLAAERGVGWANGSAETLIKRMTPADVAEAEQRARNWRSTN